MSFLSSRSTSLVPAALTCRNRHLLSRVDCGRAQVAPVESLERVAEHAHRPVEPDPARSTCTQSREQSTVRITTRCARWRPSWARRSPGGPSDRRQTAPTRIHSERVLWILSEELARTCAWPTERGSAINAAVGDIGRSALFDVERRAALWVGAGSLSWLVWTCLSRLPHVEQVRPASTGATKTSGMPTCIAAPG